MPPIEVPEHAVLALLARWFPDCPVALERMGQGVSTPVYRVIVDDEVAYLRLGEEPGERRDAEVRVHELVRALGVNVPEMQRWEPEPPELDRSAALTSRMPGIPLGDYPGDARAAARQAGRDLARINAIPVVGYGWADFAKGKDRHLVAEHPIRAAWVAEYLASAETVLAADVLPSMVRGALTAVIGTWAALPDRGTSHLAHGDLDVTHIYVDPDTGAYQGLIDFGEIRGTDPLYDLGHLLVNAGDERGRATLEAVVAGYAGTTTVDRDLVWLQAIAIATRALAIQLGRAPTAYRDFLQRRLGELLMANL